MEIFVKIKKVLDTEKTISSLRNFSEFNWDKFRKVNAELPNHLAVEGKIIYHDYFRLNFDYEDDLEALKIFVPTMPVWLLEQINKFKGFECEHYIVVEEFEKENQKNRIKYLEKLILAKQWLENQPEEVRSFVNILKSETQDD